MRKFAIFVAFVVAFALFPASLLLAQKADILDIGVNRLSNGDFEEEPVDP